MNIRNTFRWLSLAAALTALVLSGPARAEEKLVMVAGGGSYFEGFKAAHLESFEQKTGIKVELVEMGGDPIPQMKAQVESGNVLWDVVLCSPNSTFSFPELFEPIDRSIVTATDLGVDGAIGERFVLNDLEAFPVLAYRSDEFADPPKGWADFYDTEAFPGPRALPSFGLDSGWTLPATALLALGVAPENLIPFDLDRAYELLDAFKPHVRAYFTGFTQAQDLMRSGEVVMTMMTDGRALQLIRAGVPVGIQWNQGFRFRASVCAVRGAPNVKNAMKFFNHILTNPENQVKFSMVTMYGPPTRAGADLLMQTDITDFTTLHVDELIPDTEELLTYIQTNSDELLKRWNAYEQQ